MERKRAVVGLLGFVAALGIGYEVLAATTGTKLDPEQPRGALYDFGAAVAASGDTVAAVLVSDPAFVYVFDKSDPTTWPRRKQALALSGYPYNSATSIAIRGDTIAVGSYKLNASGTLETGAVQVFERTNGAFGAPTKIVPAGSFLGNNDRFGEALALSEDGQTLVVGKRTDAGGAVHVFMRDGGLWTEEQVLTLSDKTKWDNFGHLVAISRDTLVVGNPARAPYVFVRSGTPAAWSKTAELDGGATATAWAMDVSTDPGGDTLTIVVGDPSGYPPRSARVYVGSGASWQLEKALSAPSGASRGEFGQSVAVNAGVVVVGAPYYSETSDKSAGGEAFLFARPNWDHPTRITSASPGFGRCVAISGATAVVGSGDEFSGPGSVFVYAVAGVGPNHPPAFTLPVIAAPNPVVVGVPVGFATLATDADVGNKVAYEWHFGDGTTLNAAATTSKPFATPGDYAVFARATDGRGGTTDSEKTTVHVVAAGVPYFDVTKLALLLRFDGVAKDRIKVSGKLALADGSPLAGKVLSVDVGGSALAFTLNAKGKSPKGSASATLSRPKRGVAKFKVKMTGSFAASLADEGMSDATVKRLPATIHTAVTFDGTTNAEDVVVLYTAKAGKSGSAR